jgi:hypothetical protein
MPHLMVWLIHKARSILRPINITHDKMKQQSLNTWQTAALDGLKRYAKRNKTRLIARAQLIAEEMESIVGAVKSRGATPAQTLSRVLQELRQMGILNHVERGVDLLLDAPLLVEAEDYPTAALDIAIDREEFMIGDIPTGDVQVLARRRNGQSRLRYHAIANYVATCAMCDVAEENLLVASHIVRWADDPLLRGRLSNVICLCRMHDALFENGYISIDDDLRILAKKCSDCKVIHYLQHTCKQLRTPRAHAPMIDYLYQHRHRNGFA